MDRVRVHQETIHRFLFARTRELRQVDRVRVLCASSEGDGLALVRRGAYDPTCADDSVMTVVKIPKTVAGDEVTVSLQRHYEYYAEGQLVSVCGQSKRHSGRNDGLILCEHFGECSGCQLQMLPYEKQLDMKQTFIKRAFRYFYPDFDPGAVANFGVVVGSPMQYSYRTKLTPHTRVFKSTQLVDLPLPIGFESVSVGSSVVDVHRCPIAVGTINEKLPQVKAEFHEQLVLKLQTGSPKRVPADFLLRDLIRINHATGEFHNVCLTHRQNVVTEKVGDRVFQFEANEFFQNNRSILPSFLDFIGSLLARFAPCHKYIIDAYCGCGFLGISLCKDLPEDGKVYGIEISKRSIEYAKHNAAINGIKNPSRIEFISGDSESIFTNGCFLQSRVTGAESVVLMNPSRKGSTETFLKQLAAFKPQAIVYVSCNVFTQARDLAFLRKHCEDRGVHYKLQAVTGFDFYPQTKHVESVAVLVLEE